MGAIFGVIIFFVVIIMLVSMGFRLLTRGTLRRTPEEPAGSNGGRTSASTAKTPGRCRARHAQPG